MTKNQKAAHGQLANERDTAQQARRERSDWRTAAWLNALEVAADHFLAGDWRLSRRIVDRERAAYYQGDE